MDRASAFCAPRFLKALLSLFPIAICLNATTAYITRTPNGASITSVIIEAITKEKKYIIGDWYFLELINDLSQFVGNSI